MAKYIPKVDDVVFVQGKGFTRYVVVRVDSAQKTADLSAPGSDGARGLIRGESWSMLHHLDESQNALRIIREATEGK